MTGQQKFELKCMLANWNRWESTHEGTDRMMLFDQVISEISGINLTFEQYVELITEFGKRVTVDEAN